MDFPSETGFNDGMNTQIISEQGPLRVEERYYLPTPVDSRRQGSGDQAFRRFPAERGGAGFLRTAGGLSGRAGLPFLIGDGRLRNKHGGGAFRFISFCGKGTDHPVGP